MTAVVARRLLFTGAGPRASARSGRRVPIGFSKVAKFDNCSEPLPKMDLRESLVRSAFNQLPAPLDWNHGWPFSALSLDQREVLEMVDDLRRNGV